MAQELTPPDTTPQPLTPPEPVAQVAKSDAERMVKLTEPVATALDHKAQEFVASVMALDTHSDAFKQKVTSVETLGTADIRAAASVSNRMLERPVAALDDGVLSDKSPVARSLIDLRKTVEDLRPPSQDSLFSPRKLLGVVPFGNRINDYFMKYRSAQSHINSILESLYRGQDELRKDNAAVEQEKVDLWATMQRLKSYAYMGQQIDTLLTSKVAELEASEPEKARLVKEELLFQTRQKVADLYTQLAVSVQGYLALDLVRKNNLELIKGVDRATTTTVSALRTAVIVAQALANQKLVLDQITALNATTGNLIESTSEMLKRQSEGVYQQAAGATVDYAQLERAFANTFSALDTVSNYKAQALGSLEKTVDALRREVNRADSYLDRERRDVLAQVVDDLALPPERG